MAKKRTYRVVFNEIIANLQNATDEQWEELLSLSTSFLHLEDGHKFANPDFPKWEKKFLKEMIKIADKPSDWFLVATATELYSPAWDSAVENLLENARESEHILYRWKQINRVLPKDHPNQKEVRKRISTIRKARKKARG